jgi:protein ImuA
MNRNQVLADLRTRIAAAERHGARPAGGRAVLPFGLAPLDRHLPDNGLILGALHEFAGDGADADRAAAATLFLAGILARMSGPILWVLKARDLFAPGLAGVGLHPDRVIYAETGGQDADVLRAMEEGLRHGGPKGGLAAVVGELTRLPLAASRRLHLAAEAAGTPALVLRRWRPAPAATEPNAATTRWRVSAAPGPSAGDDWTMPRARWRLALGRCRAGEPMEWIVEACDAQGRLAVPADLADRPAATPPVRWVGGEWRDRRLAG